MCAFLESAECEWPNWRVTRCFACNRYIIIALSAAFTALANFVFYSTLANNATRNYSFCFTGKPAYNSWLRPRRCLTKLFCKLYAKTRIDSCDFCDLKQVCCAKAKREFHFSIKFQFALDNFRNSSLLLFLTLHQSNCFLLYIQLDAFYCTLSIFTYWIGTLSLLGWPDTRRNH